MWVIIFGIILIYFFIKGILSSVMEAQNMMDCLKNTQIQTKVKVDEINLLNENLKKEFIEYSSINNMNEDAKDCFYEYIVNSLYIKNYVVMEFVKKITNHKVCHNITKLDKYSINKESVLDLINKSIDSLEYKDKIMINTDSYITFQEETGDSENGYYTTIRYLKIKIVKETDLDEILKEIKEYGDFSLDIFKTTISKREYNRYLKETKL